MLIGNKFWPVVVMMLFCGAFVKCNNGRYYDKKSRSNPSIHVDQCMAKIVDLVQPCNQQAISNWNLNHSLFVPSKLSVCCANWQAYTCFLKASLVRI